MKPLLETPFASPLTSPFTLLTVGWLFLAGAAGCGKSPAAAADTPPPAPVVASAAVDRGDFASQVMLTAEFIPYQEVDVMAKVAGYVKDMNVDMGDRVRAGELLATLEVPEMQDEMRAAEGAVKTANDNIATARNEIERAQAAAQIAQISYTRIRDVLAKEPGLVPQQDVDVAHSKALEAQAELAGAQSDLQAAQERAGEAADEQARLATMYRYTSIAAPFDGVVTKRYANVGSMIQAGTSSSTQALPIVRLAQNNLLRLILPVPVTAVPEIHIGQDVDVNVVTVGRRFPGKVIRFADEVQMSTRTMDTEVDVPNPNLSLVPGMYAEVDLRLADHKAALSVPLDAVMGLGTASTQVFQIGADQRLHQIPVQVGLQSPTRVEILPGSLRLGDMVVVGRQTGLADGERVQSHLAAYDADSAAAPKGN